MNSLTQTLTQNAWLTFGSMWPAMPIPSGTKPTSKWMFGPGAIG